MENKEINSILVNNSSVTNKASTSTSAISSNIYNLGFVSSTTSAFKPKAPTTSAGWLDSEEEEEEGELTGNSNTKAFAANYISNNDTNNLSNQYNEVNNNNNNNPIRYSADWPCPSLTCNYMTNYGSNITCFKCRGPRYEGGRITPDNTGLPLHPGRDICNNFAKFG